MTTQTQDEVTTTTIEEGRNLPVQAPPPHPQQLAYPPRQSATPEQSRNETLARVMDAALSKASTLQLTDDERQKLRAAFPDDVVEVLPTKEGLLYIPHALIRNRLNDVIGAGQWRMVAMDQKVDGANLFVRWAMLIRGVSVGETWAGRDIDRGNNARIDLGDDFEATEGVAVRRIAAKMLGCGIQVWEPAYCRKMLLLIAVKVWTKSRDGKSYPCWRRKDAQPFWNEVGGQQERQQHPQSLSERSASEDKPDIPWSTESHGPAHVESSGREVTGPVEAVSSKSGEKNGKEWTKYGVKIGGQFYGTFSKEIAAIAEACSKDSSHPSVRVVWEPDSSGRFKNIVRLEEVNPVLDGQGQKSDDIPM